MSDRTITILVEATGWTHSPAVGVSAGGGSLLARIQRLTAAPSESRGRGWPVAILLIAALGVVTGLSQGTAGGDPAVSHNVVDEPNVTENAGEEPVIESPRDSAGESTADRAVDGIAISVLDANGQPIARFRIIAGVNSNSAGEPFRQRTGHDPVNWQPHTLRVGTDGAYVWPLKRAYKEMALRVEADGYEPQVWKWIKRDDGATTIVFRRAKDAGVNGRVIGPDGRPASGATIALALPQKNAVIEGGKIRGEGDRLPEKEGDRWRRPTLAQSDAEGRFRLPTETEPAAVVVVVHESGVLVIPNDEFLKSPELRLQQWGRIEGRVQWQDRPGSDEAVSLSIHRDTYGYPGMVSSYATTRTDDEGRFTFTHVLPGRVQVSRPITFPEPTESGAYSVNFPGLVMHTDCTPGEPTHITLGGKGRLVSGRMTGRDRWDDVQFHFHPTAPNIGFPGDDDIWKAFGMFRESAMGPVFFRNGLKPNEDGSFAIQKMLPGNYQLFVRAPGVDNYAAYRSITIPPEPAGEELAPIDLGEIMVKPPDAADKGDRGPPPSTTPSPA